MLHRFNELLERGVITEPGATPVKILQASAAGALMAYGTTKPSDGATGYCPGCIFIHTDGGDNTALYVNEGTKASADFNLVAIDVPVDFTGLTATIEEINQYCDESAKTEVVTATNVLTAAESGKTMYLDALAGFLTTLPAPALGLNYNFIVKTAPTSNGYTFAPNGGTADILVVNVNTLEINDTVDGLWDDNADLITLVANQAAVGDWLQCWSDGTKWHFRGSVKLTAGLTTATT